MVATYCTTVPWSCLLRWDSFEGGYASSVDGLGVMANKMKRNRKGSNIIVRTEL